MCFGGTALNAESADSAMAKAKDQWTKDLPRRFYKEVRVVQDDAGHVIHLDGRTVRTPLKNALNVPAKALADAIAEEWSAQGEKIVPATMPITKIANTSIDHSVQKYDGIVDEFVAFAGSDLLCYRADTPQGLVERQQTHWDPLLGWVKEHAGAVLVVTAGVIHQSQPEEALALLRRQAAALNPFRLTALQTLTALTGSAVLSLAISEGEIAAEAAWTAANVDEDWQIELWGWDAEAERQRASRRAEFDAAVRFLDLLAD